MGNYSKYIIYGASLSLLTGLFLYVVNNIWTTAGIVLTSVGGGLLLLKIVLNRRKVMSFIGKRSTKYGANAIMLSVIVLGILALGNFSLKRHSWRVDTTSSGQYSLAKQTISVLRGLEKEVKVTAFQSEMQSGRIKDLLEEYSHHSGKFTYDVMDPDKNPDIAKKFGIKKYGELVIQSGGREERIQDINEEKLTNGLIKLISDKAHKIYFLSGHGEKSFELSVENRESLSLISGELNKVNYQTETLHLFQQDSVPADASLVLIAGAEKSLLPREVGALRDYLSGGGSLMLMFEPRVEDSGINELLSDIGVTLQNDIVLEQSASFIISGGGLKRNMRVSLEPTAAGYGQHSITEDFRLASAFPTARSLEVQENSESGDYDLTELVLTSGSSWGETDFGLLDKNQAGFDENRDNPGPVVLAVVGKVKEGREGGRIIVVGDSDFPSNSYLERAPGNKDLFLNMVSWLLEDESLISIRPRDPEDRRVSMTLKQTKVVFWLLIVSLPVAILGFGIGVYFKRRKY